MNANERTYELGGLPTTAVGDTAAPLLVVLLHGYAMQPADLTPFAHSIGVPATFLFPTGPLPTPLGGRAWWDVDTEARALALAAGPRDLANEYPAGVAAARAGLADFLAAAAARFQPRHVVLGGFSQGGMLSLDYLLHSQATLQALVLLSSSRITLGSWEQRRGALSDLPVFVSHGEADRDLDFAAGTALKDFVLESGARVDWVPFPGGHEIPLVVWRGLRKFLTTLIK